jgi:hypothetical protein
MKKLVGIQGNDRGHWVGDGFYAKKEVFDLFIKHKRHFITRPLRRSDSMRC